MVAARSPCASPPRFDVIRARDVAAALTSSRGLR
jgi:hypothetical protein